MKNRITKSILLVKLLFIVTNAFAQSNIELSKAEKSTEEVGEFTGTLNVTLPIASVSSGSLTLPISLSYVSNGLKPNEASSTIGLGWVLNDVAIIYKNQQGMEDYYRDQNNNQLCIGSPGCPQSAYFNGAVDGGYDIYTYNILGNTGKFVFDPVQNSCIQLNKSDLKITKIGILSFIVVLADGTTVYLSRSYESYTYTIEKQTPVWYARNIYSYDNKDTIRLDYNFGAYKYNTIKDNILIKENAYTTGSPSHKTDFEDFPINVLTKVVGKNDSIIIDYTTRLDLQSVAGITFINAKCSTIKYISDNICIENELLSDYYEMTDGSKQQVRLKEIKTRKCGSVTDTIPRYKFEYYGITNTNGSQFMPPRTTTGIDAWGFYNGATSNPIYNMTPTYVTGGVSNRNISAFDYTKYGMLKKLTDTNGGVTSYEYQQNKFNKSISSSGSVFNALYSCHNNTCSGSSQTTTSSLTSLTSEQILNGVLSLSLNPAGVTSYTSFVDFKIKNNQNAYIHTISYSNSNGSAPLSWSIALLNIKDIQGNPVLVAGNAYYFELTVNNGNSSAICNYTYNYTSVSDCGGLRVSKVTNSSGNVAVDIVTNYTYEDGVQYQAPQFYDYVYGLSFYFNRTLKDENILMDYNIGYRKVTISKPSNGKVVKIFKADFNKQYGYSGARIITDKLSEGVGSLLSSTVYDNNNNALTKDSFEYEKINYGLLPENHNYFLNISNAGVVYYGYNFLYSRYSFKLKKTLSYYYQNLINASEYTYGHSHTVQPSSVKVTNGNGNIMETYTDYTNNTWVGAQIKTYFINKNLIVPYNSQTFENSIAVAGNTQHHAFYNNAGVFLGLTSSNTTDIVRASQSFRGNYNLAGSQTNSLDPAEQYNHEYTIDGQIKIDQTLNWPQKTYTYDKERPTSTLQNGFANAVSYFGKSNLVQRKTNIDGTYIDYTYDGMMRLKTETQMPANIVTEYFYNFYTQSILYNSVKSKTTYPLVAGSALNVVENISYIDKLGRTIAKVNIKASPSLKDVLIAYEYDNQGRLIKEYLPVETIYTDGTYTSPSSANVTAGQVWKYKETKYEASPLSRISETIPTDWYAIKMEYGLNTFTSDAVANQAGGNYADNKLIKETIIDGNGNRIIKFTDFKGRLICERHSDAADTPSKRRDTYTHYDNKNRITKVIPPDATTATLDLIYEYIYDNEDKLTSKKIPGKGLLTFYYNNKDLIASEQDAVQAAKNPKEWMVYSYDTNGRQLKSGLYISNTAPDLQNPTFTTVYTENIYGTTGIEKDKVKTSKVNILGTANNLQSTFTYDTRGRVESYVSNNILNLTAADITSFTYDNGNNVLTETKPLTVSIGSPITYTITNSNTYDHRSRMLDDNFKYNTGVVSTLATNEYNWRSDLVRLRQGKFNATIYLQDIDYNYRANGMLERVNQYLGTATTGDLFYQEFYFDNPIAGSGSTQRKNGEMSNIKWQRRGATITGGLHAYSYNEFGELLTNNYSLVTGATTFATTSNFDETFYYNNKYGKITSHTKNNNVGVPLDNLNYNYITNSPRTANINDASANALGHNQNGQAMSGNIYTYDLNGNQKNDPYRGVTNIDYNFLDLPTLIDIGGGKKVAMTYDATGNMLTKKVYNTGSVLIENRYYNKGFEFVAYGASTPALELIHHSQGYYRQVTAGVFRHEYVIKDHLGNTRIVYTDADNNGTIAQTSAEILDENHYYAYGMEMNDPTYFNSSIYKYKFNGIERTESIGLNIDIALYRGLDPVLGKWYQVDPKAEAMMGMSPYCAMGNNPVLHTDPNGDVFVIPLIIGAALFGGVSNLATNYTSGMGFGEAANYFVTGATGYAVGTVNPIAGAAIVAGGNLLNKGINGKLKLSNAEQVIGTLTNVVGDALGAYSFGLTIKWQTFGVSEQLTQTELKVLAEEGIFPSTTTSAGIGTKKSVETILVDAAAKTSTKMISQFSSSTIDDAVGLVMKNSNDVKHIFAAKHNLGPLVNKLGGQENTIRSVLNAANGKLPASGVFNNIPVNVGGQTIFLRGNVINGVPRIGTMFIP